MYVALSKAIHLIQTLHISIMPHLMSLLSIIAILTWIASNESLVDLRPQLTG
ncbi:hypothetical protein EDE11_12648 [Methylomonas methanica]|uniref:Uncharacterized protein n=1 Tax=Methylomonas methanica TaxID=421 RepID=A0ABY2CHD0_METMH|nr:hypothetical protein EDE11_12648 [Methylomonas methanica]